MRMSPRPRGTFPVALLLAAAVWIVSCENPLSPELCGTLPDQTIAVGETVVVDLCFRDPNGEALDFDAFSSDAGVATVQVAGSTVTITAVAPGTAVVTVVATDPGGLEARQSFQVVVPNRPPNAVGAIDDRELMVGDYAVVDVAGLFSEPDGQPLRYSAAADPNRLAVSMEGTVVTVVAVAKGTVEVTVTATDPGGLAARLTFRVTVPNRPPVAVDSIAAREVMVEHADTVDVSPFFSDSDGDPLVYTADVSEGGVVWATVSGSTVTVTGLAKGEAVVTITATDDEGLTAEQSFAVTVPNRPPVATDTIPSRMIYKNQADTLDLAAWFADPDGDPLTWAAEVADARVVALDLTESVATLIVTPLAEGETVVTVTATDPEGLSATQHFTVTVPNRPPAATDTIPSRTIYKSEADTVVLARYFSDPDDDPLTYAAATSNSNVVALEISATAGTLTVTPLSEGATTVTITATDPEDLTATQSFTVTVPNRPPAATAPIPAQTLHKRETAGLDLTRHFNDPDADLLQVEVASTDTLVATATADSTTLTVRAGATGEATLTVTVTDPGGLTAQQSFTVTVLNRAPVAVGVLGGLSMDAGGVEVLRAPSYFSDPDGDDLSYSAGTNDPGIATASATGSSVIVRGVRAGRTTLTLTATDPDGLSATQSAEVEVSPPPPGPEAVGTIPNASIMSGEEIEIDVAPYFRHPNGHPLRYTAGTSSTGIATVGMLRSTLQVKGVGQGTATITVIASDPNGQTAVQQFRVRVRRTDTGFEIQLGLSDNVTGALASAIRAAAATWESIVSATEFTDLDLNDTYTCEISGTRLDVDIGYLDDLAVVAAVIEIDGAGGTLAIAGPCYIRTGSGSPVLGAIVFDEADIDHLAAFGDLTEVAVHEIAHILGFGLLADWDSLIENPSSADPRFSGALATTAFNAAGGAGTVPVESNHAHWRESALGLELMTPQIRGGVRDPLSAITIQALADMGYRVNVGLAEAYAVSPAPAAAAVAEETPALELRNDVYRGPVAEIDENGKVVRIVPGADGEAPRVPQAPGKAAAQADSTIRITIGSRP